MAQAYSTRDHAGKGGILMRGEFTSFAMAAALLAGLLAPIPERVFDVLLIVGLCLAMAVVLSALLARRAIELGSFPMLVAVAVLFRMGQDVAAARMILFDNRAGTLVGALSRSAAGLSSGWLTILVLGGGLTLGILALRAAARTRQRAIQFTVQGAVIKRAAIAAERQLGSLNMTQSRELMRQIGREVGFHQNMTAVASLLACQAVVALVAVSVTALVLEFRSTPHAIYEQAYLSEPLIVGFAGISLGTTLLLATTSAGLLSKPGLVTSRLELANNEPSPQKVTIVSEQSGESEEVELINPEFLTKEQNNPFRTDGSEVIATFEPVNASQEIVQVEAEAEPETESMQKYASIQGYYMAISDSIVSAAKPGPALLISQNRESLPVTVMVNVAIQLARRGQRIGLIDLDTERKAVAEVFDVSGKGKQAGLVSSCIENIAVWMGDANSVQQAVTETQKACGHVLIYAPQSTAWAQPALQDCGRVVAFGHGVEDMEEIQGLCRDLDEGVLAMFPSPSEAVE